MLSVYLPLFVLAQVSSGFKEPFWFFGFCTLYYRLGWRDTEGCFACLNMGFEDRDLDVSSLLILVQDDDLEGFHAPFLPRQSVETAIYENG